MTDTYLAAWVTNTASRDRGTSWCWSPPYAAPAEASAKLKEMADEGTLIIGFVVVWDAMTCAERLPYWGLNAQKAMLCSRMLPIRYSGGQRQRAPIVSASCLESDTKSK